MPRTPRLALAVATVSSLALVAPLGGVAEAASACASQRSAVTRAQQLVAKDVRALGKVQHRKAHSSAARKQKRRAVARAKAVLAGARAGLHRAEATLEACNAAPAPYVPVWKSGTTLQRQTAADGSAIAPLSVWDGVDIAGSAYGSSFTADPAHPGYFYGLTDRGPNVAYADGDSLHKLEPLPGFQDAIGWFRSVDGQMRLQKRIGLTTPGGEPYGGLENVVADAGETIYDLYGNALPKSMAGLDTEGIVVMPDGSFWISDEYGPLITHFDATGRQDLQLSPYADGTDPAVKPLPAELRKRNANKGMEGLTLTPDGHYLVGIMQSSLNKNGATATSSATSMITRIVRVKLSDYSVQEYVYSLHDAVNPTTSKAYEGEANSEITALPDGTFLVDERDGKFEGQAAGQQLADKNLFRIDLDDATDVGPRSPLLTTPPAGTTVTWDAAKGLLIDGATVEDIAGKASGLASPSTSGWQTKAGAPVPGGAAAALAAAGVTTVSSALYLNYAGLVSSIDPSGMYFGHDKVEGVAVDPAKPNLLYLSNDSDFGITDMPLVADGGFLPTADRRAKGTDSLKTLPDGKTQDFGEVLVVDMTKVPAAFRG